MTNDTLRQLPTKLARINRTITEIERLSNRSDTSNEAHFELLGVLGSLQEAASKLDMIISKANFETKWGRTAS